MFCLSDICREHEVKGYPTIKYFNRGKFVENYQGDRTKDNFVNFINTKVKTEL